MKLNIAIVDDCIKDMHLIKDEVLNNFSKLFDVKLSLFTNRELNLLLDSKFDLYLLDIDMGDIDGISLAKHITEKDNEAKIVFVSNREDLVFSTFKVNTLYFVRKKKLCIDIKSVLEKLNVYYRNIKREFVVKIGSDLHRVYYIDILYFESSRNYVNVYTKQERYTIRSSLKEIKLSVESNMFIQPHNSYYVNLENVSAIQGELITMQNNTNIPISRKYKKIIKEAYMNYLVNKR